MDDLTEQERTKYGKARMFDIKNSMKGEALREADVVCGVGENITLSQEERQVLALGSKFCVRKRLEEEKFDRQLEEWKNGRGLKKRSLIDN